MSSTSEFFICVNDISGENCVKAREAKDGKYYITISPRIENLPNVLFLEINPSDARVIKEANDGAPYSVVCGGYLQKVVWAHTLASFIARTKLTIVFRYRGLEYISLKAEDCTIIADNESFAQLRSEVEARALF